MNVLFMRSFTKGRKVQQVLPEYRNLSLSASFKWGLTPIFSNSFKSRSFYNAQYMGMSYNL